jgi:MFS family permease
MAQEIREGLRLVFRSPVLRAVGLTMATYFFFDSAINSVYILFATRDLGLDAGQVGLVYALGNLGFLAGTFASGRIARRLGVGRALILAIGSSSLFGLLAPLAAPGYALPILVISRLGLAFGIPVFMINQIILRQSITPDRLLGRLTGTMKFVAIGVAPIGALVGGVLGTVIGVHGALAIAAAGSLASVLWLVASPIRHLMTAPEPWRPDQAVAAEAEAAAEAAAETHRATVDLRS